ncbi:Bicarbonate transport system permease protein CmpB [Candidatus Calditenuaceae archaeon HR02]|nr:Bicarbonate transport system permease protein CmpB [Candidatus Calditenuaceae archaeon HR02]
MLWEILAAVALSWTRIVTALAISVFAAIIVGIYSGIYRRVDRIAIPILDVLQSVPILGFFPLAVYVLASAVPVLGYELASIFLLYTCTFWNLAFAVYEGARSIPHSMIEVAELSKLSLRDRFGKIYVPAVFPKIVDQLPASLANAFYFLAASEVIALGEAEVRVAGIGTLILRYLEKGNYAGIAIGLLATALSIIAAYLFILMPLISYSDRYRFDIAQPPAVQKTPMIMGLYSRIKSIQAPLRMEPRRVAGFTHRVFPIQFVNIRYVGSDIKRLIFIVFIVVLLIFAGPGIYANIGDMWAAVSSVASAGLRLGLFSIGEALAYSFSRVLVCLALMLAISLPIAYVVSEKPGLRNTILPVLQIIASLPSPLIFPIISGFFVGGTFSRELGAVLLMSLGSVWYVFYSTLSGFNKVHGEYRELARLYRLSGINKFRYIYLPFATPSIVTGLITATGGAWNTVIVAERLGEGGRIFEVQTPGLGKLMSTLAEIADTSGLVFTVMVMTAFVILVNRLLWRNLYDYSIRALRIHEQL